MATPRKWSPYGQKAAAMVTASIALADAAGRAYEHLEHLKEQAAAQIAAAEQTYATAYAAAQDGGWSRTQLDALELPPPAGAQTPRRRPASRPVPAPSQTDPAPGNAAMPAPEPIPAGPSPQA